ncbi:MAG: hypothetical protein AB7E61_06235 [Acholeplasmataceae bacterium]
MSNKIIVHEKTLKIQYQNGMSVRKIAELHNVSQDVVRTNLKDFGIKRINKLLQKITKKKLEQLYCDNNWSINKIANRYDVKWETVHQAIIKCDLIRNPEQRKTVN